ncbi:hypothetical protein [Bradyrhizobium australiense]|uniref:Uncharacterized protein n=1 Tax=Bradyrhizobium australiense TaxID=2721161 RepID=A0A7Y4GXA9_9BRAD|nr:hypothetical protein [Bradyrhizobium australiense]NOJ43601.1 hypothetical protein [Bradyrhizobium australiense]
MFKAHQKWKEIDHKTQRLYEQGLSLFANHRLKDGTRAGSKQISDFMKGFVDAVYAKLLVVEEKDADGNIVRRERRRFANAAMVAAGGPGSSVSAQKRRRSQLSIRSRAWG